MTACTRINRTQRMQIRKVAVMVEVNGKEVMPETSKLKVLDLFSGICRWLYPRFGANRWI